jgi:5-methylcytosine-specific restriction protein A
MKTLAPRFAPPRTKRSGTTGWQPDTVRGNRHQRGYGAAWERLRIEILERDAGLCQPCLKVGVITTDTAGHRNQVDHIVPKTRGGTDDPSNLQTICPTCHKAKTARESNGGGV